MGLDRTPCNSGGSRIKIFRNDTSFSCLAGWAEQGHIGDMADKRPKARHSPSQRSIQRWENEGGATKDVRANRPCFRGEPQKQDIAADLAGQVIDRLGDRLATFEERERRKRRLLKGPKEFRKMRRDDRK